MISTEGSALVLYISSSPLLHGHSSWKKKKKKMMKKEKKDEEK